VMYFVHSNPGRSHPWNGSNGLTPWADLGAAVGGVGERTHVCPRGLDPIAGEVLGYPLRVRNPTDAVLALEPRPIYRQVLAVGDRGFASGERVLNCESVPALPPGEVAFEMQLRVTPDTPASKVRLRWLLRHDERVGKATSPREFSPSFPRPVLRAVRVLRHHAVGSRERLQTVGPASPGAPGDQPEARRLPRKVAASRVCRRSWHSSDRIHR
jgi:hypothetical protein